MKHTCCWVLRAASAGVTAEYCGAPVKYTMRYDDDDRLVRHYAAFCDEHQKLVDEQDAAEEEETQ